ncbi:hypothetical protein B0H13DRAFT_1985630 [Mycena leptocephala]|nr:hypothetical protein B0H13DRAFT_1985630 [Mycena leptocephala]
MPQARVSYFLFMLLMFSSSLRFLFLLSKDGGTCSISLTPSLCGGKAERCCARTTEASLPSHSQLPRFGVPAATSGPYYIPTYAKPLLLRQQNLDSF